MNRPDRSGSGVLAAPAPSAAGGSAGAAADRLAQTGVRRRTVLASSLTTPLTTPLVAALGLPGCASDAAAYDGAWVGQSWVRGHLLRQAAGSGGTAPAPELTRRCAVAVVGGGVAGLAAARALQRAGVDDIRVFELEDEPGGNARGHTMGGMACPLGAHYLPMPGGQAPELADWLYELGLLRQVAGRTVADERHLCHSPQERLWLPQQQAGGPADVWLDGLLPPAAAGSGRLAQYRRFASLVAQVSRQLRFSLPTRRAGWTAGHAALDADSFDQWLGRHGLDDPALRWYLDYCCRDDYGAGTRAVSAWAGLHYFASRHGFHASGDGDGAEREAVFTWPEGNAWLTRRLAAPLGERLVPGAVVRRVEVQRHGVVIDLLRVAASNPGADPDALAGGRGSAAAPAQAMAERWLADQVVLALPLHVASRVVVSGPPALPQAAAQLVHAPWLVANLQLHTPLTDKPGAPPSWDNVLYRTAPADAAGGAVDAGLSDDALALGYVDAMHQRFRPMPGPTVLTAYWALGDADHTTTARRRLALLASDWRTWAQRVVADLARAHPDLPRRVARVDLMRYGHAMAVPTPGARGSTALRALVPLSLQERVRAGEPGGGAAAPGSGRLHFAHSDLSAYSVFEEAFTLGDAAGRAAALALRRSGPDRAAVAAAAPPAAKTR